MRLTPLLLAALLVGCPARAVDPGEEPSSAVDPSRWAGQLSAGTAHTCAIEAGSAVCWGIDDGDQYDEGQVTDAPGRDDLAGAATRATRRTSRPSP